MRLGHLCALGLSVIAGCTQTQSPAPEHPRPESTPAEQVIPSDGIDVDIRVEQPGEPALSRPATADSDIAAQGTFGAIGKAISQPRGRLLSTEQRKTKPAGTPGSR